MDPPENSVNRIGRTIWTVWGYLSGAVARYLRPEVTAEGNQSVHARTDEIDLKSAVNKIDREVKTNNSDDENDSAEVKRSSSNVRAAASVQWENTGAVKSDDDDKLHVHTTKKQTYNCAAWSTGTETDSEGRTAEKVSSDEVQAEEEHANCESEERETTQEPQVTGETEQTDGDNKEECDENHEVEKCAEKREDADNTDVMIQSEQDVELDTQISVTDRGETQDTGGLKHEHPTDETEKQITVQKNQEKTENDEDQGTEPQVQDLLDYLTDEANSISKPERLKQIDKYSEEIYEFSQSGIEEMRPGSATEQDEESQTAQDLEEIGRFGQKDGDGEERDQDREVEKCDVMREDWSNTDVMIQSEQDVELDTQISVTDRGETQDTGGLKHEHPTDETEKQITVQKNQEKTENDEDQGTEPQVQDLLDYLTDEAYSISKPKRLKQIDKYSEEIADVSKNQIEEMMPGSATEQDEESQTAQDLEEIGRFGQKDGDGEERDQDREVEKCDVMREDWSNTDVMIQSEPDVELDTQISVMDCGETQDTGGLKHEHPTDETEKQITVQKNQEKTENDEDQGTEPQVQDLLDYLTDEAYSISKPERLKQIDKYSEEIYEFSQSGIEEMRPGSATEQDEESQTAQDLEEIGRFGQKDGDGEERDQDREVEKCDVMREDWSNTDVMIQSEQDVELDTQISVTDRGETQDTGGLKHEHPTDETEKQITVQKNQEKTENDEDQGTEPQVQDLLDYLTDEAYSISKPERLKQIDKYSEEIADVSKNQIEEMMPGSATEQDEESQTAQDLEEIGRFGQKDGDGEERDQDREVEKCDVMREDWSNTDVMIQSEPDVELDTQISVMDCGETQDTGGLKHEHPTDETEKQITVQKNQEKTENDEDQGTEPQVQDLLDYLTDEAYSISKPERLKQIDKYSEEIYEFSQSGIEEMRPGSATEQDEESQTAQDLEEIGRFGQKDGDGEERDQDREVEKCDVMREDWSNTDVMIQSEQDVELDTQISVMDRGETQDTGGLKHEHPTDETEKQITVQKNQEKTENDEDQGTEPQVQDLLDYLTDEANSISKPERLNQIDKYSEEIDEFSQSGIEEMRPGTEQDEDTTNREQDMTKYELIESAETLQRESESEKHVPNDETELKMPTVTDETVDSLEDTLLSDSEQDTLENTPESGTGSSVLATKTEGMFSDLTVCEFPGESKLHDAQSPAGERAERDSEDDTETLIQAERQQIHKTQLSLEEHVEFRTELIVETEDEEAEAFETESRSAVIRNVTLQPHELLEFTGGQCTSSQGAMDTFSETQGNASASDITGTAEHVSEDQTDVKPVSMRSLSPTQLLEEPLDLQADVAKTALEYVEQITNQVLKEMKEAECNLVQKTEPLVGLSTEEAGDAEHQAPAQCVSDASVLEEERTLLAETMDSSEEHISSAECENTDGRHEQMQKSIAGETVLRSHEDLMEVSRPGMKRGFDQVSKGLPEVKTEGEFNLILQAFEDSSLDFSVQKSRIAVKNPLVRPPKDPRKLLFRASAEPLPQPSDRSRTLQVSAPSKGMIGFKLPGLGAGLPVLRRTEFVQKAEAERTLQPQKSVAVTEDSVKQEQVPAKPKWTPPRHPGMGSPFMMAELKNKLKKPVQE